MKITVTQEPVVPVVRDAVITIKISPLVAMGIKNMLMDELTWVGAEKRYNLPKATIDKLYDAFASAAYSKDKEIK